MNNPKKTDAVNARILESHPARAIEKMDLSPAPLP